MSNTPIDEHSEEFDQLAGLYALHVLEGDELARFEGHAAQCERCRLMVGLDRETLARVALVAPAMDPSPDFKARLMRRAAAELAASAAPPSVSFAQPEPQPNDPAHPQPQPDDRPHLQPRRDDPAQPELVEGPRPPNVVPFWRRSPWMSALAAVLVVALVTAGAFTFENQTVATYELTGSAQGSARVVVRRSGAAELDMTGVPNPEPGFIYEAWIITAGKPVAAGTTATGDAKLPLSGDLAGTTVAITQERGRVDQPTNAPILATVVQS
jgi:anti-sigma-K factor RskA